jgi:hypothetical protein
MKEHLVFSLLIAIVSMCYTSDPMAAHPLEKSALQFEKEKLTKGKSNIDFNWDFKEVGTGIKFSLKPDFIKSKAAPSTADDQVWSYQLDIDGITVFNEHLPKFENDISRILPFEKLTNGQHNLDLILWTPNGKKVKSKGTIKIDSSPIIAISKGKNDNPANPTFYLSFLGEHNGVIGFVDIKLDGRLLTTTKYEKKDNNRRKPLSEMLGSKIFLGDLQPGKHLIQLVATGVNGSNSAKSISIPGNVAPPSIKRNHTKETPFQSVEITFPESSKPYGFIELRRGISTIWSKLADKQTVIISRDDVLGALEKHNAPFKDGEALTLLLHTSAANQVENWQELHFK